MPKKAPGPGPRVRPAVPEDAATLAALHRDSLLGTYPDRYVSGPPEVGVDPWRARIDGVEDGTVLVLEDDAIAVGLAWVSPSPDADDADRPVQQVRSIHVRPDRVGGGLGRLLLDAAERAAGDAGATSCTLWVVDDNVRAIRFYRRAGWEDDGAQAEERLPAPAETPVRVVRYRKVLTDVR